LELGQQRFAIDCELHCGYLVLGLRCSRGKRLVDKWRKPSDRGLTRILKSVNRSGHAARERSAAASV
jgi:hypothetical protein